MKTLLVTGTNRSGTTWVGKMLQLSGQITEVYEPFNDGFKEAHQKVKIPFSGQYHYILPPEEKAMARYLRYRIDMALRREYQEETTSFSSALDLRFKAFKNFVNLQLGRRFILYKDPIAILSAEWIYRHYNAKVLVLIRHPAAYVASIKRLNWSMGPSKFKSQPEFMQLLRDDLKAEVLERASDQ